MEVDYVQNETHKEGEGQQAQELVSESGQSSAGSARSESGRSETPQERRAPAQAQAQAPPVELFCLAPDELFNDELEDDVLHDVLSQGFLLCGNNAGWIGPWCRNCQWSSAIDHPTRERAHRRRLQRAARAKDRRSIPDDFAEAEL